MRIALFILLLSLVSALGAAEHRVAWNDSNPADIKVLRYVIYDTVTTPATVVSTIDSPKTSDGTVTVTAPVDVDLAGRTIFVTAVNDLGLESLPSDALTLPVLTAGPTALRLAFDFTARTITLAWSDPNAETYEYVVRQDGAVVARTTDREAVFPMPDEGRPTYTVTAVGFWNEAASDPIQVPVLTAPVPVTSLRIVRD